MPNPVVNFQHASVADLINRLVELYKDSLDVVNYHDYGSLDAAIRATNGVNIMRGSPLGNPFITAEHGGVFQRNDAIDMYFLWLKCKFNRRVDDSTFANVIRARVPEWYPCRQFYAPATAILDEFDCLIDKWIADERLSLVCCCSPSRCHGDVIYMLLYLLRFVHQTQEAGGDLRGLLQYADI